ncbi:MULTISPECIES: BCCT family transporter [Pontibacillus]|uniref:BCCT family transporter n=1 Tax=Pontibacillus chungwhensis TaxID=265426 RepID=A0ABY8V238_9BACI|nr:BCCT family transporter [Pontibacillus chungwhensis]MCD5322422.1 BCCT family transporter [Pontibacillus sp. HN14]WIF99708.1 BCCT family transporter [Pontibacillus chungwhensis]
MKSFTKMFWISLTIGVAFVLWGAILPDQMFNVMSAGKSFVLDQFGWFYQLATTFFFVIALVIAFSKYGKIKLGKEGEEPEYSTSTWFAMLFSAGMGIGLLFYGVSEPVSHYSKPPFGDANTIESAKVGLRYTYLHWGFHAWAIYAIVALALAYYKFKKDMPGLMSVTLRPVIGDRANGPIGMVVDIIAVFATLFGVAISLGIGAQQINGGLNFLFEIPNNFGVQLVIMGITTVLFITSAASGLSKGIRYLSNANLILAVILFFSFLFLGPTQFMLETFSTTFGSYIQNLPSMGLRFSPFQQENNQWVKDWTIFYWAWWISWTPFVSTFIARVSRGRSVREFLVAVIIAPSIVCALWFGMFGSAGIFYDHIQGIDVAGQSLETALFFVFEQMNFSFILSGVSVLLILTFFVTSADSATFVLGMQTHNGSLNPPFFVKLAWGIVMVAVAAILMWSGGVDGLQAATIITGLPLTIILLIMTWGLLKSFSADLKAGKK